VAVELKKSKKVAIMGVQGEYKLQRCEPGVKPEMESTEFGCC
jgi:hypothetical protein